MVIRGDIWLVALDPTVGSEIQKTRPCVVVSPEEMHGHLHTILVTPMTTKAKPAPYRVPLQHGGKKGLILVDQLRVVDRIRLVKRVGGVPATTLSKLLTVLQDVFAP